MMTTAGTLLNSLERVTLLEAARIAESIAAESMAEMLAATPPEAGARYDARVVRLGSALAQVARRIDVPLFNRVLGLGLREPVTDALLDAVEVLYQDAKVRYMLQLCPAVLTPDLHIRLEARGWPRKDNWAVMMRGVEPPPEVATDLRVEQIGVEYAHAAAEITCEAFEMPPEYGAFLLGLVGRPGWQHYLAFDGDTPVAAGALFVRDGAGYLTFGATLPAHRGRGGQGAIMARRIRDAAALGSRCLVTETGEDTPEHPNPSYRNMLRLGFRLAYLRPNYIYSPE